MIKKELNWRKSFLNTLLALVIVFGIFWYRSEIVSNFWGAYMRYFNYIETLEQQISLTEREELERLRIENRVLKNDLEDLKSEISLIEDGLEPTYVKMLGSNFINKIAVDYYGSFYTTYPKDKTVYKGMNIYTHGNVLVGTVEEVLKDGLFVSRLGQNKPFLAESSEVDEQVELSSMGNGLYAGSIAAGSKISVGDQIVLRGYPKAIVGMVGEIIKNDGTLSTVLVRAPYNIYQKEIFYILQ